MNNNKKEKHIMKNLRLIGLIIALLLFVFAAFQEKITPSVKSCITGKKALTEEEVKQQVIKITNAHNAHNLVLWQQFEKDIAVAGENEFQTALEKVTPTVNHFSSVKECAKLVYCMAYDKIKKSNKSEDFLVGQLAPVLIPCKAGEDALQAVYLKFIHQLQENNNQLQAQCAKVLQNAAPEVKDSPAIKKYMQNISQIFQVTENMAVQTAFVAVGLGLEAVCWKQTWGMLTRLTAKLLPKITASVGAHVVDGPLPVGDIIALLGWGWSAYDIYRLKIAIPRELRTTLTNSIDDGKNNLRQELRNRAWADLESSSKVAQTIVQEIQQQ